MTRLLNLAIFVTIIAWSAQGFAQEFSKGVRPAGMGDAFTAIGTGTSGIYHNPAGVARALMYAVEGQYAYTPSGNVISASIVDSKTNPAIGAGLGYSYYFARGDDNDLTGHDIRVALGIPVIPNRVSVGIGGRWLIVNDNVTRVNADGVEVQTDISVLSGPTIDAGVLFQAADGLHLGISAQNLIDQCENVRCKSVAPTTIAGGISFGSELGFLIAGNVAADLTSGDEVGLNAGVGAEYLAGEVVPIRAGFKREGVSESNILTFGLGWRSPAAGVDAGYQLNLSDTDAQTITGSFSIYF